MSSVLSFMNLPSPPLSPALLALQEFSVGGDFYIQGQFDIEQILVLLQVSSHLLLQRLDLILQTHHCVLIRCRLNGEPLLHLTQLTLQRLVLQREAVKKEGCQDTKVDFPSNTYTYCITLYYSIRPYTPFTALYSPYSLYSL